MSNSKLQLKALDDARGEFKTALRRIRQRFPAKLRRMLKSGKGSGAKFQKIYNNFIIYGQEAIRSTQMMCAMFMREMEDFKADMKKVLMEKNRMILEDKPAGDEKVRFFIHTFTFAFYSLESLAL